MRARCTLFFPFVLALAACGTTSYGDGIGRPTYPATDRPERLPLSIVEVYVADDSPANRFAIVTNSGAEATAVPLTLESAVGAVPIPEPIPAGGEERVSLADLGQPGTTLLGGELAVVDDQGTVHAYLAWVSDPNATGSTLEAPAYASGATALGAFVPGGFPMPRGLAFVSTSAGTGCVAPSDTSSGIGTPSACPVTPEAVVLDLLPAFTEGAESWVRVRNQTAAPLDLFGLRVCQAKGCVTVSKDVVVAVGGHVTMYLGAAPAGELGLAYADPLGPSGELALRAPGSDSADGDPMLQAYVRYGASNGAYIDAAVEAGLWPSTTEEASAPRIAGEIVTYAADVDLAGVHFVPAADDADVDALPIGPTQDLWTSCSYPRPWRVSPTLELAITEVARASADGATPGHVTLTNRTTSELDLTGVTLEVTGTATPLDLGTLGLSPLAAGAALTVDFAASGCAADVCWPGPTIGDSTELALRSGGTLMQYLAFGSAPGARAFLADAITRNVWPGASWLDPDTSTTRDWDCGVPSVAAGGSVTLDAARPGTSPADWH